MITAKGVGFLIAAVLVFLLARFTQVGWLYLVDAVLWGIIILSAVLPWSGVAFLAVQRRVEFPGSAAGLAGPSEEDIVRIELSLHNRGFWPRFVLSLRYDCPLAEPGRQLRRFFVAQLRGSGQTSMTSEIAAYQRGLHRLGPVALESSAPFGLFRRRSLGAAAQPVLVYPKVHHLKRLALVDISFEAATTATISRVGMEPVGSRPYAPGDPRRYIHWRNTARTGRLMVKEFDDSRDPALCLLFDATQVWGEGKETTLEYAIKLVASAADYAMRSQVPVRIWGGRLQGQEVGPAQGGSQGWLELLKDLALMGPGEGGTLTDALGQVPPGSSALVVVAAADHQAIQAIQQAAPGLHRLVVVALEGFGAPEPASGAPDPLALGRTSLVRCRPGGLTEALQSLEASGDILSDFLSPRD